MTVIAERTSAASSERDVLSLTADGTIGGSLRRDMVLLLTKNGVAHITLEAPGASHEGLKLDILSSAALRSRHHGGRPDRGRPGWPEEHAPRSRISSGRA